MAKGLRAIAIGAAALAACGAQSATTDPNDPAPTFSAADRATLKTLAPAALPAPPADVSNRFADDARAAKLGQRFFNDPGFSGKLLDGDNDGSATTLGVRGQPGRVACAGCHVPASGFVDTRTLGGQISLASSWVLRRTPSLLDVGQAKLLMWDGRRDSLQAQVLGPLETDKEMNSSRLFLAEQIFARYKADYEALFGALPPLDDAARFPPLAASQTGCDQPINAPETCHGRPGDGAEYDGMAAADQQAVTQVAVNFGKAIAAFERKLTCGPGRFDAFVAGDANKLTHSEQRGAALFIGKAACLTCHSGPFLTDQKFHVVGLAPARVAQENFIDANDRGAIVGVAADLADPLNVLGAFSDGNDGRLPAAATPAMEGAFRTPALRCVSKRPSFLHTGQFKTLEDVVAFFDGGGHPAGYPGTKEIAPLGLTAGERADLAAFLRALDGPGPDASLLVTAP